MQINRWIPYFYLKANVLSWTLNLTLTDFWEIFLFLYQKAMSGRDIETVVCYSDGGEGIIPCYVVPVLKTSQIPFASEKVKS